MRQRHWAIVLSGLAVAGLLVGCSSGTAASKPQPQSEATATQVPAAAEGISFVQDGSLRVVRNGRAEAVPAADKVQAVGRGSDAGGIVVMGASGSSNGQIGWYQPSAAKILPLWRTEERGNLGSVRYLKGADSVWFSVYGDPKALLKSAAPPSGSPVIRKLDSGFSGEFDVDAKGEGIVFVGASQLPSTITLRDAEGESLLPVKLGLIFSPDFSADGTKLCFVGGQKASDLSIWVYDIQSGESAQLTRTRDLGPTVPVFSADGTKVAFRSSKDGSLWITDVSDGQPVKLPFTADEGPIGW